VSKLSKQKSINPKKPKQR